MQCRLLECCQQADVQWQEAGHACCQAGAYIISGGLGSLGLLVTQWLTLSQPSQASLVQTSIPALLLSGMSVKMSLHYASVEERGIKRARACSFITPFARLKGSLRVLRPFSLLQLPFSWAWESLYWCGLSTLMAPSAAGKTCNQSAEI